MEKFILFDPQQKLTNDKIDELQRMKTKVLFLTNSLMDWKLSFARKEFLMDENSQMIWKHKFNLNKSKYLIKNFILRVKEEKL